MGEFLLAREHLETARSLYVPEHHRALAFLFGGIDPGVNCVTYTGFTLWQLGYPDQALKRSNEALALAQGLSHPFTLAFAEYYVGVVRQLRREARAAQEAAEGVIALSAERGLTDYLARAASLRGWAIFEQGHKEEGIAQIREGMSASQAIGTELYRTYFLILLAEACIETDRLSSCRSRCRAGAFQTGELAQTALIKRIRAKTRRGYVLNVLYIPFRDRP
jgi:predicted ATPase